MYCELHLHTGYSLLDGSIRIDELVQRAKELNMPALAITDHGYMYGVVHFYKACQKAGIKPIIGCEVYVAPRSRFQKEAHVDSHQYHLTLLAQNEKGYENLSTLVSLASIEGFYYKPRIDKELLAQHTEGIICLSGCISGEIPTLLIEGKHDEARAVAEWYKELFQDRFFIEIQDHNLPEEKQIRSQLVRLARELDIPLVTTNDVHYLRQSDAKAHDVLLCIQTQKTIHDEDRIKFGSEEFYLKGEEEMLSRFRDIPEAVHNSARIADMVELELKFNQMLLPPYRVPEGFNSAKEYLRHLCYQGLHERFSIVTPDIEKRLEFELKTINDMGFDNYFLIVWDYVNFAKKKGIRVGPGRGSAAGSLVSYVLHITDINPLKYDLLFERFLNPYRVTMPDIDIDFCYERRGEVIQYVREKYGEQNVAQICTFGTMAARMAVRDVGRALDIPYGQVDKIAKMIPQKASIQEALDTIPELQKIYEKEEYRELLDIAKALEGLPRHASTHAAGVVISDERLTKYTPLQKTEDGITTQYDMTILEEIGLLKMDFLGLRNLTVIKDAIKLIGEDIDINNIPLDDPVTYELLSRGDTAGVFQLESPGMRSVLKELKPSTFEDIIAVVALYRPGPMDQIPVFIENKFTGQAEYLHPDLEPILRNTYGVIVYQEQIIRIAHEMAGYTLGEADLLRRAVGKKKKEIIDEQRAKFIAGVEQKYGDRQLGEKLYDLIEKFAEYGFNKSHAAAYAMIAYQTAYLKAHYPVQFMTALLTSVASNADKVADYIHSTRQMGIQVLPPDVNESQRDFTVTGPSTIRFGLAAIKNVGEEPIGQIIYHREQAKFTSLHDFCSRVDLSICNRRTIESLIKAGAFGSLGGKRSQYLHIVDKAYHYGQSIQKQRQNQQMSLLFEVPDLVEEPEDDLMPIKEFPHKILLQLEKEMLGLYISGHPLDEFRSIINELELPSIAELEGTEYATIAGYVTDIKRIVTRKGDPMCFLKLEDYTRQIDVVVFPNVYEKYKDILVEESVVVVSGKVQEDPEIKVLCDSITVLEKHRKKIVIEIPPDTNERRKKTLKNILLADSGNIPVYVVQNGQEKLLSPKYWLSSINPNIEKILGPNTVKEVEL